MSLGGSPTGRDHTPMRIGRQIELPYVAVEITAITEDGHPAEAAFRFTRELEDPSFRWMQWKDGVYVPFELPPVGNTVTLPGPRSHSRRTPVGAIRRNGKRRIESRRIAEAQGPQPGMRGARCVKP